MRLRAYTTLLLALVAPIAAGCGADEEEGSPIPQNISGELQAQLNSIQDRFEFPGGAACADITDGGDPNTTKVRTLIDSLPNDVDADVRDALRESFDRLFELVEQQCAEEPVQTETETTETEPVPTETVPTETVPTETVPTETVPTETVPPPETVPPEEQSDGGTGDGDGGAGFGEDDE